MKQIVSVLPQGPGGLSAYQTAVKNGFVGTESEWLAALQAQVTQANMTSALTNKPTWRATENSDITYAHDAEAAEAGLEPGDVYFNGTKLRAIPQHHPTLLAYEAMLQHAGKTPADAAAFRAFKVRASEAFRILEGAGILDDVVCSAYFGSDGNAAGADHITFQGASPAASGAAPVVDLRGMTFAQSGGAQFYEYAVPNTKTGTVALNWRTIYPGQTSDARIACMATASAGFANSAWDAWYGGSTAAVLQASSLSSAVTLTGYTTYFPLVSTASSSEMSTCFQFGATAGAKTWTDGIPGTPSPSAMVLPATDQVRFCLSGTTKGAASWPTAFKGTYTSFFLFGRTLTNAEAVAAHRAMLVLRKTEVLLIVEGDSTSARTFTLDVPWSTQLQSLPGWEDVRVVNLALSGDPASALPGQFPTQSAYSVDHPFAETKIVCVKGGINDRETRTAAQIYADILATLQPFQARGYIATAMTNAPVTSGTAGGRQVLLDANDLLRAGVQAGDFDYLADPAPLMPHDGTDNALWTDSLHPSAAGYAVQAQSFADAVPLP